jgi:hypothetical protein
MVGIKDDLGTWEPPATWAVGDVIDADTWEERVYNPISLLLRRPLFVATLSTDSTVAGSTQDQIMSFDTLVHDDDGMLIDDGAASFSEFYAQRDGIFAVYAQAPFVGNGSHDASCKVAIWVNSNALYAREAPVVGTSSNQDHWRAVNGDVSLTEGDYVQIKVSNNTGSTITIKSQYNAPRIVIMWKRPFLS